MRSLEAARRGSALRSRSLVVESGLMFQGPRSKHSQMSTTSDLDLSAGTSSRQPQGTHSQNLRRLGATQLTIPGFFQTTGMTPAPGVNFTLIGGSDVASSKGSSSRPHAAA